MASKDFIGFVAVECGEIAGAVFAHRKTWWTNDEIFVDELFVSPDHQGQGCGKLLLEAVEQIARQSGWGGVTLLTNRYHPAKSFYEKNGYSVADHVIFMYKETH